MLGVRSDLPAALEGIPPATRPRGMEDVVGSATEIVALADRNLHAAKRAGRNCVVVTTPV